MRVASRLGACLVLALLGAAPAADRDAPVAPPPMEGERMAFVGIGGAQGCASFLKAVEIERQASPGQTEEANVFRTVLFGALMGWADGYITAHNEDDRLQRLAGAGTSLGQRARWLELFCQANPTAGFFAAAYRLREHLVAEGL